MKRSIAALSLICTQLLGCASVSTSGPKIQSPTAVYVWPVDSCPSEPPLEGGAKPRFAAAPAVLAALGGDLINAVLAVPFAALNSAAQADKSGFSVSNTQIRNYYSFKPGDSPRQPGCFIVAYAAPGGGSSWCASADFKASVPACANAATAPLIFDSLPVREPVFIEQVNKGKQEFKLDPLMQSGNDAKSQLALPQFYIELALRSSPGTPNIVTPEAVAMYYPKSLIDGVNCKKENGADCSRRALTLTITLQGAAAGAGTSAKFGLTFTSVTPSPQLTNATWSTGNSVSWTALPAFDSSSILKNLTQDGQQSLATAYPSGNAVRIFPATLNITLGETKDPNIYLQALNGAFNQQAQTQLATAIANGISFGGMPSVDAQAQAKSAGQVLTDKANAASALASLIKDCKTSPALASADLQVLIAKEQQANLDATQAGQSQPYPDPGADGRTACPGA